MAYESCSSQLLSVAQGRVNYGHKPLPPPNSTELHNLTFLVFDEVCFSVKLAAPRPASGLKPDTVNLLLSRRGNLQVLIIFILYCKKKGRNKICNFRIKTDGLNLWDEPIVRSERL
jgi:hypothetical protein